MSRHPVAIVRQEGAGYPEASPFHPAERYPEFPGGAELDPANRVFDTVRRSFLALGLDREHAGSADWNPLGGLVHPGDTVFLKPNMISHRHRLRDEWDFVITHGAVLRAVLDYVHLALRGEGAIWLGDAPQTDSKWDGLMSRMGLAGLRDWYASRHGFPIEVLDLRDEHHVDRDGIYVETVRLPGDPRGGVSFDLAGDSMFAPLDRQKRHYYGAYYDWAETNEHHHGGRHEYRISRSPLQADVFISVPKLKTHKKCGFTVNLKGLVGINADKNWLPHYAFGSPGGGGDQFEHENLRARLENWVVRPAKQLLLANVPGFKSIARRTKQVGYTMFGDTEEVVRSGNWHGNDTVWRMCLDLNRILMFGDPDGTLRDASRPKRYFSVVDGIVAMEGNGPVAGERREAGIVIAGGDPVAVDDVCARLMGFDPQRLALLRHAFGPHRWPLFSGGEAAITPVSNVAAWNRSLAQWRLEDTLRFRPHFGWTGAIEWR
ncbi:MAG TPA: DUF362 domain-containing protein [Candidatus Acidoferrales bacterium]|nr:DUF362 domain-containing protein [Candidatus Acidoferrales bacterium]